MNIKKSCEQPHIFHLYLLCLEVKSIGNAIYRWYGTDASEAINTFPSHQSAQFIWKSFVKHITGYFEPGGASGGRWFFATTKMSKIVSQISNKWAQSCWFWCVAPLPTGHERPTFSSPRFFFKFRYFLYFNSYWIYHGINWMVSIKNSQTNFRKSTTS